MVTKPVTVMTMTDAGYILAKNHMVTKLGSYLRSRYVRYILAKNHMVTKHSPITIDH